MKLLWIDDLRDPVDYIDTNQYESVLWLKTYSDAHAMVSNRYYDVIHLDNDLSDEHDRQGKHLFNYIEELLYSGRLPNLKSVIIHSDNSSAVRSMMLAKDNFKQNYNVDVSQMIFKSHN